MIMGDWLDALNIDIIVYRYNNQNRWFASIKGCMVKDEYGTWVGLHGSGRTPDAAINNYIKQIIGKTICFEICSSAVEYKVPAELSNIYKAE